MTELAAPYPDHDLAAAELRLATAVAQLVEPTTQRLDRDHPLPGTEAWTLAMADLADRDRLRARLAAALRRRDRPAARRALDALARAVTAQQARTAVDAVLPPLLDQLAAAVESTQGGGGAAAGVHRSPIGLAAAELLADIRRTIRWGELATDGPGWNPDTAVQLRRWVGRAPIWRDRAPGYLLAAADRAEHWVDQTRLLLDPPRRWSLAAPCPDCGARTAHILDDTGQTVRRPAIEFDRTAGTARCLRCPARWTTEAQLRQLARVLAGQD